jgi:isopentenyl-diphosphate delta-isomerase
MSEVRQRKLSHLELCIERDVESHRSTLFSEVQLLHEALPELAWHEVDASVELLGRRLQLPIVISGMTGGAPAVLDSAERLAEAVRALMVLTGTRRAGDLRHVPRVLGPELARWAALCEAPS